MIQNSVVTALILTYTPSIILTNIPIENEVCSSEESSLRYLLWKIIETFLDNLQWSVCFIDELSIELMYQEENCCFLRSKEGVTDLFSIHPFLFYLACIFNFRFMQRTITYISTYTFYRFEMYTFDSEVIGQKWMWIEERIISLYFLELHCSVLQKLHPT